MDYKLSEDVYKLVDHAYTNSAYIMNALNDEYNIDKNIDIDTKVVNDLLSRITSNLDFLYTFKKSFAEENNDFTLVKNDIEKFILDSLKLCVALNQKQNNRIRFTNAAINAKSNATYFENKKESTNQKYSEELKASTDLEKSIKNIVSRTDERITSAFGEFDDKTKADVIVNMEFDHLTNAIDGLKTYLRVFATDRNSSIPVLDNVMPIIATVESIMIEAFQLRDVLGRAERYYNLMEKHDKSYFSPKFVVIQAEFDANSIEEYRELLRKLNETTYNLNEAIKEKGISKLTARFNICKDNQIHGIVNMKMEDFVEVLRKEFKDFDIQAAYSTKNIPSLIKNIMRMPYEEYDILPSTIEKFDYNFRFSLENIHIKNGEVLENNKKEETKINR